MDMSEREIELVLRPGVRLGGNLAVPHGLAAPFSSLTAAAAAASAGAIASLPKRCSRGGLPRC